MRLDRYKREISAAAAFAALLLVVAVVAPGFFTATNLRDLALNNAPVLLIAIGATLVILTGEIDISVGSMFAVCSIAAGWFAREGMPIAFLLPATVAVGALMGAVNGFLVGTLRLPSIIVTLAMLVAWRDGLRWVTQGAWIQDLPPNFQWFGLGQVGATWLIVGTSIAVLAALAWALRNGHQREQRDNAADAAGNHHIAQARQVALQNLYHKLRLYPPLVRRQEVQEANLEGNDQLVQIVDLRPQVGAQKSLQRFLTGGGEAEKRRVGRRSRVHCFDQPLDLEQLERLAQPDKHLTR